jgi:hypothetical protein
MRAEEQMYATTKHRDHTKWEEIGLKGDAVRL